MTTPTPLHDEHTAEQTSYTQETRKLERRDHSAWVGGLVLIVLGGIFLLRNVTGFPLFNNWWALFLFIPIVTIAERTYRSYRDKGYLDAEARGWLTGALIPTAIGLIFLFNLNFSVLWPVLLILAGVAALINAGAFTRER